MNKHSFGFNLTARMRALKMSHRSLSTRSGISVMTLNLMASGRNDPSLKAAQILADALECTVDNLNDASGAYGMAQLAIAEAQKKAERTA